MLIDFHTHIFPEKIAPRAIKKLEDGIACVQGGRVLCAKTDGTLDGLLSSMERFGVDLSVVMPIATSPSQHTTINSYAAEITDYRRIISFGSIHPLQEDWEASLEHITQSKLPGIKLHPEFQDFYVDQPVIFDIVKKCQQLKLFVLFHSGADLGFNPPVHCTPEKLRKLVDKTGCTNIIAAHFGAFRLWDDVDKYLVGTPVMMDISMTAGELDKEQCRKLLRRHGADKILFASDSPWQTPRQAYDYLMSLNLTASENELIMHKNAEKILFG